MIERVCSAPPKQDPVRERFWGRKAKRRFQLCERARSQSTRNLEERNGRVSRTRVAGCSTDGRSLLINCFARCDLPVCFKACPRPCHSRLFLLPPPLVPSAHLDITPPSVLRRHKQLKPVRQCPSLASACLSFPATQHSRQLDFPSGIYTHTTFSTLS